MDARLLAALQAIDSTVGPLPPDVIGRTREGRWSIAEILEHLTLAFTASADALEKVLAHDQLRVRRPSLKQVAGRIVVLNLGYFPKVKAPAMTVPSGTIAPAESLAAIRAGLTRVDDVLSRVAAKFGERVAVLNHPFFAGLSVDQWRTLHSRHTVHHMRQITGTLSR
jgi:hypothetical protein